jgi:hypothetical protein
MRKLGFDKDTIADMLGQETAGIAEWYAREAELEKKLAGGRRGEGKNVVRETTAKRRFARSLAAVKDWCRTNRHRPPREQRVRLSAVLIGHYAYYGITGNIRRLQAYRYQVGRIWHKWPERQTRGRLLGWEFPHGMNGRPHPLRWSLRARSAPCARLRPSGCFPRAFRFIDGSDGELAFVRKSDLDVSGKNQFWSGVMSSRNTRRHGRAPGLSALLRIL